MSNLVVSNISDGTTSVGTGYVVNGSAKAWANFNGSGTVAIRDSQNVSSITDTATGKYSVNLTNSMSAVDYSVVCMDTYSGLEMVDENYLTVSSYGVKSYNNSWTLVDPNHSFSNVHGDLA